MHNNPNFFKDVAPDLSPKRKALTVIYTNPESRYMFIVQGVAVHIERIVFTGDLSIKLISVPISKITKYINEKNQGAIAESVHFNLIGEKLLVDLAIHKITDKNEIKLSIVAEKK